MNTSDAYATPIDGAAARVGGPADAGLAAVRPRLTVHLWCGYGFTAWRAAHTAGGAPNPDHTPYSYHLFEDGGFAVRFSEDRREGPVGRFLRRAVNRVVGCDILHALHNRHRILGADVVWTHSEREAAAVALLVALWSALTLGQGRAPQLVTRIVWLLDDWGRMGWWRRTLYRRLLGRATIAMISHRETDVRALLPDASPQRVPWGIDLDAFLGVRPEGGGAVHDPVRVLSVGNDEHRDWEALFGAFAGDRRYALRVLTPRRLRVPEGAGNVELRKARGAEDVKEGYAWADVVVLPLRHNLHISGITVLMEAAAAGVPIVATRQPDLDEYLGDDEVLYVADNDPATLRAAVDALAADPARRRRMADAARRRMVDGGHRRETYVRHCAAVCRSALERAGLPDNRLEGRPDGRQQDQGETARRRDDA
ncbi:MAG TPA: glycosyltransferase [Azospirillum sp.]